MYLCVCSGFLYERAGAAAKAEAERLERERRAAAAAAAKAEADRLERERVETEI